MPLDPEKGEIIDGLGSLYRVAPKEKWERTPMFEEARIKANEAFRRTAGKFVSDVTPALTIDSENFIVQEYPFTGQLAFVFSAKVNGEESFYPYVFQLPPQMTDALHVQGMWSYTLARKTGGRREAR